MDGEQLPAKQPEPIKTEPVKQEPQGQSILQLFGLKQTGKPGQTVFEMFGVKKETSDKWWRIIKILLIFGVIAYFVGIIADLFLGQKILQYAFPLLVVVLLMYKFWGKDLLTKK